MKQVIHDNYVVTFAMCMQFKSLVIWILIIKLQNLYHKVTNFLLLLLLNLMLLHIHSAVLNP